MPYGVLLYRRCADGLGLPCSSRKARAMHAPRQERSPGATTAPEGEDHVKVQASLGYKRNIICAATYGSE
jgi:hypothetical protein